MYAFFAWILGRKETDKYTKQTKEGVLVNRKAHVVPIPVARDITQTKEFWDKAVPS